jgi:hypothetical protein
MGRAKTSARLGHGSNPAHGVQHQFASEPNAPRFSPNIMDIRPAVYLPSILLGTEFPQYPSRLKLTRMRKRSGL